MENLEFLKFSGELKKILEDSNTANINPDTVKPVVVKSINKGIVGQGKLILTTYKNPRKYMGDPTKIQYRSLWERKCMIKFDENPNILRWASEEMAIPYLSPVDRKRHRYYPDFLVELKYADRDWET